MKDVDLAYAAGAIDGEGCIGLHRTGNKSRPSVGLRLSVFNTDPRLPYRMQDLFGGNVYVSKRPLGHKPLHEWVLLSAKAADVLKKVYPYLVIKKEQADIALDFAKIIGKRGPQKSEIMEKREDFKKKMHVVKSWRPEAKEKT